MHVIADISIVPLGVGLCQNGAFGLARSGMTFDQILTHYYTGIELIRWDGK